MDEDEILPIIESPNDIIRKVGPEEIEVIIVPGEKVLAPKKVISVENIEFPRGGFNKTKATAKLYKDMVFLGDDGNYYQSKKNKKDVFIWVLVKKNI